jgi:peptidoglycan/xylan/chitin deacetylase (PgdA/CDA1 family)
MARPIPHLMYHEIERPGRSMAHDEPGYVRYVVAERNFGMQLESIRSQGYAGLSVAQSRDGRGIDRAIVITFDDGCESDLVFAAPALQALGFGATFYITTGFLGQRGFMTRTQLRELGDLDFDIGCHAATHRYLSDLPKHELDGEIRGAKAEIESIIGRSVDHFSCPGGRWNTAVEDAIRSAGFTSMATSDIGTSAPGAWRLDRLAVMRSTSAEQFDDLCAGRGLMMPKLQTGALRVAKQMLGNARYEAMRAVLLRRSRS